jgi:hypothetical protein
MAKVTKKPKRLEIFTDAILEAIQREVEVNIDPEYSLQNSVRQELTVGNVIMTISYEVYVERTLALFNGTHDQPADDDDIELLLHTVQVHEILNSNDISMPNVVAELNKQLNAFQSTYLNF